MDVTTVNIGVVKARFTEYARRVKNGETIVVCDRNRPFAELRPLPRRRRAQRPFGLAHGLLELPSDFNAPDPEIEAMFNGEDKP